MMYGKIFESIYDGTLVEDWRALITFQQFIVLCDADGIVDMTPNAISRRTGIPIEHIKAGIEILEHSDLFSRTKDNDGKRIIRLDDHRPWGWSIVNHQKYKMMQNSETIRDQNRERKRKQRLKEKEESQNVTPSHASHGMSRHTDTDTDKDSMFISNLNFLEFWENYPRKQDKKKSKLAWNRISKSNQEKILLDIKTHFLETKKQFIPLPTTYLNGERWNDESDCESQTVVEAI